MTLKQTPSQTVGPYFACGLTPRQYGYDFADGDLTAAETQGERIRIEGRVLDGAGQPVSDATIGIWQAGAGGRHAHPADGRASNETFSGFGRAGTGTDSGHRFMFRTVRPGATGGGQAPHINAIVFMRGILSHAFTRIYFPEETEANAGDAVLNAVPAGRHAVLNAVPAGRRATLIAEREERTGETVYRFDIHMRGERETVFFDV